MQHLTLVLLLVLAASKTFKSNNGIINVKILMWISVGLDMHPDVHHNDVDQIYETNQQLACAGVDRLLSVVHRLW